MGYLVWFGIVALVFALMHYFTELNTRQKGLITLLVTLFVIGAIAYNIQSDRERSRVIAIELQYRQGKNLICHGIDVNNTTFSYSDGTQSFIGNPGTAHEQQILNARECQ
jgi:hypothetical protein